MDVIVTPNSKSKKIQEIEKFIKLMLLWSGNSITGYSYHCYVCYNQQYLWKTSSVDNSLVFLLVVWNSHNCNPTN